ncbi:hypothetical protein GO988_15770 [Hymenobacter sp. HMF4947]|uniref:Uncharacterized protein n=1 Tax=Hymenobacter ginkgonis TaxID=2682976 RepID=A0A7K1THA7_9BACT|nr:hypothetical protein [Hymenobacter ginkgonis]MVN77789.1 hypothetical protein [Hymenobacter ginkgonis]
MMEPAMAAGREQTLYDTIPSTHVVGEAVQQEHDRGSSRTAPLVGSAQYGCFKRVGGHHKEAVSRL